MSDNELLMMAAKAAGHDVDIEYYGQGRPGKRSGEVGIPPVLWNPLEDDGDAFRLAAKLSIDIYHRTMSPCVFARSGPVSRNVVFDGDESAVATRRAIVKVAASIGEAK